MEALDRLLAKIDPLFKPGPFDPAGLPPGFEPPPTLRRMLERRNGGYFWGGALHVLGAVQDPVFHSLAKWNEPELWKSQFGPDVEALVFFAEDAFGDQFGLGPDGKVYSLRAEQGLIEELADDFDQWLLMAVEAADELLARGTFTRWMMQHRHLPHGSQLQAYPPFLFAETPEDVELEAVEAVENMHFHAALASQLAAIPEGSRVRVEFTEEGIQISSDDSGEEPGDEEPEEEPGQS